MSDIECSSLADGRDLYLPTLEMLHFVMSRLRGGFLLLEKIAVYCRLGGEKQMDRIRLGHFWNVALGNIAVASRIW